MIAKVSRFGAVYPRIDLRGGAPIFLLEFVQPFLKWLFSALVLIELRFVHPCALTSLMYFIVS
ncbi:hypothetical protein D3C86_1779060 [compost metagenome]